MNLLVLGPQGSGKGTQAKRISAAHGIPHVSTGDMFRAAVADGTELGRRVEPILASGDLVPDDLTVALIRERLLGARRARRLRARRLPTEPRPGGGARRDAGRDRPRRSTPCSSSTSRTSSPSERIRGRARDEGRDDDDSPDAIARRLAIYHEQTEPVVERYRATGKLVPLHADRSIDEVSTEIEARSTCSRTGQPRDHPQGVRGDRPHRSRRRARRRDDRARRGAASSPGVTTARARQRRRRVHPCPRRRAHVPGLQGLSARDLHLRRRRRRPRHPGRHCRRGRRAS